MLCKTMNAEVKWRAATHQTPRMCSIEAIINTSEGWSVSYPVNTSKWITQDVKTQPKWFNEKGYSDKKIDHRNIKKLIYLNKSCPVTTSAQSTWRIELLRRQMRRFLMSEYPRTQLPQIIRRWKIITNLLE